MHFNDKIVVITGGTDGIGLCIVNKLLMTGIKVIILFELESSNSITVFKGLQDQYGDRIDFYPCDIANTSQLKECFRTAVKKYNAIDIFINNAFVINENDPERMIDINYKAVILGSLMMVEHVGKHKGGKGGIIVNISSILGLKNFVLPIYCSTKHAVVSFTRTMMQHFGVTGVRVIAICLGVTNTSILDDIPKGLDFVDSAGKKELLPPMQSPENVAMALVSIIEDGEVGDVWVAEEDKPPYAVKAVEDYKNLRMN